MGDAVTLNRRKLRTAVIAALGPASWLVLYRDYRAGHLPPWAPWTIRGAAQWILVIALTCGPVAFFMQHHRMHDDPDRDV